MLNNNVIFVSVVITVFNKEKSIQNTINSVLKQKYPHFEIVVVNDGSTDNSLQKIRAIMDSRIIIVDKKNEGKSNARNTGIQHAKYDWIAFLDGDDLWTKEHLGLMIDMVRQYPRHKVFATKFKVSSDNNEEITSGQTYVISDYFQSSVEQGFNLSSSSVMIHKHCFDRVGQFNTKLVWGEDIDMWIRLAGFYEFIYHNKITAIYRIEAENRALSKKVPFERDLLSIIDFSSINNPYKKKYIRRFVKDKVKIYLYKKDIPSFFKLICKYYISL